LLAKVVAVQVLLAVVVELVFTTATATLVEIMAAEVLEVVTVAQVVLVAKAQFVFGSIHK
jgi:hypothetical protein